MARSGAARLGRRSLALLAAPCGAVAALALGQAVYFRKSYLTPANPPGVADGCAGQSLRGKPTRILFVGDSVCVGVGSATAGPLQRGFAERLVQLRDAPVAWCTVAASGADTVELRAMVAEHVTEEPYDMAVLICGVNDLKKFFEGRWPQVFRHDLSKLCEEIRRKVPEGRIYLPRVDGHENAPQLQIWPMRYFVLWVLGPYVAAYEHQKVLVAESLDGLASPKTPRRALPPASDGHLWAHDGMHPSEEGYRIVGAWLAETLAE